MPTVPQSYMHLAGLLDLFRSQLSKDADDISVTVRLTYQYSSGVDREDSISTAARYKDGQLLCGALIDPVECVHRSIYRFMWIGSQSLCLCL